MSIDKNILIQAIGRWGEKAQIDMIQEECMELALALQQMRRKSKDPKLMMEKIIDELADVRIMMAQAELIFDQEAVEERVKFKMERLTQRLNA